MMCVRKVLKHSLIVLSISVTLVGTSGCEWHGLNSLRAPGTEGGGPGAFTIKAQLPDVGYIQANSRVRVGDVNVGTVAKIEREGWHALVTLRLNGDVNLPANATAAVGQTSLLGSLHIELAAPTNVAPQGRLHDGSLIPLSSGSEYPSTEQTLSALSLLLNGGAIGKVQDITQALSTAFAGREDDLRNLIIQLDQFATHLDGQTADIITATDRFNGLVGQFADQKPVLDRAIKTLPEALEVLKQQREHLTEALDQFGKFAALTADSVNKTKTNFVKELHDIGPVLESLANSGPALTRSLGLLTTFPWAKDTMANWMRGDMGNLTAILDLTLSRIDSSFFTGTRWEGNLTELEMQWGRTIGTMPSPYTGGNPLVAPYRWDQGK